MHDHWCQIKIGVDGKNCVKLKKKKVHAGRYEIFVISTVFGEVFSQFYFHPLIASFSKFDF